MFRLLGAEVQALLRRWAVALLFSGEGAVGAAGAVGAGGVGICVGAGGIELPD